MAPPHCHWSAAIVALAALGGANAQNTDCNGTYSTCTAACERAYQRTWIQNVAPTGNGTACPGTMGLPHTAVDCADGEGGCTYEATLPAECPTQKNFERVMLGMYNFIRSNERLQAKLDVLANSDPPSATIRENLPMTLAEEYLADLATDSNGDGTLSGPELAADADGQRLMTALKSSIANSLAIQPSAITVYSINTQNNTVAALTSGRRLLEKADESERVVNVNYAVKVGTLEEYVRTHDLLA